MNIIYDIILIFTLIWQPNEAALRGKCNECNGRGSACISENEFAICINDQLDPNTITLCPDDYVCTGDLSICSSTLNGKLPICYEDNCNTCEATDGTFACVDEITYGFCYGNPEPDIESFTQCPSGHVCNLADPQICSSDSSILPSCSYPDDVTTTTVKDTTTTDETTKDVTTATPTSTTPTTTTPTTTTPTTTTPTTTTPTTTTPTTTTPTTTTPTTTIPTTITPLPSNPDMFCGIKKMEGYFKDESDPTCKNYIYCYFLAGQYLGLMYVCHGYFNDAISKCDVDKPIGCI